MEKGNNLLNHYKFEVPEIVFGRGMLSQVGSCARRLGGRKVFLVSDQGLFQAGWVDQVMKSLMEAGLDLARDILTGRQLNAAHEEFLPGQQHN